MLLATGPTGSGKTTTLYTALSELNSTERHCVTIEDPVEIRLPLVRHVQVNAEIGLTFATFLRAILRQDPDVILVGEIRDEETARIAIQAALTGHMVLSTLHTNDAPGAVARLMDFQCPAFAINAALTGVMGQRLARLALNRTYGKTQIDCEGPSYRSMKQEGRTIRIEFDHAEGLSSGATPPAHFTICGSDHTFVPAIATIDGTTIVVQAAGVEAPVAVRYAWGAADEGTLRNAAGLPASSFRTDSFEK
jgi:type II secretory ATPase GspE/PulE/Tfp pilus assembly ATPase PilB-like protein